MKDLYTHRKENKTGYTKKITNRYVQNNNNKKEK